MTWHLVCNPSRYTFLSLPLSALWSLGPRGPSGREDWSFICQEEQERKRWETLRWRGQSSTARARHGGDVSDTGGRITDWCRDTDRPGPQHSHGHHRNTSDREGGGKEEEESLPALPQEKTVRNRSVEKLVFIYIYIYIVLGIENLFQFWNRILEVRN